MTTFDQFFQKIPCTRRIVSLSFCFFFVGKWHKNAIVVGIFSFFFRILMSRSRCRAPISLVRSCAEVSISLYFLGT